MKKKLKSTSDEYIESLTPSELKKFEEGYKDFALSELILALMKEDEVSVRKLAKIADVSPTVIQAMRSGAKEDYSMQSFFKVLKGLGCKKLIVQLKNQSIPLDITHIKR
jgi:hypothetical protein